MEDVLYGDLDDPFFPVEAEGEGEEEKREDGREVSLAVRAVGAGTAG